MTRFEPTGLPEYTKASLLGELRRVSALVADGNLTVRKFNQYAKASHSTILRHFGTWQTALQRAGLSAQFDDSNRRVSETKAVQELNRVALTLNTTTLRKQDFDHHAKFSADSVVRRFGSWRKALQRAELSGSKLGHRYSDEECFDNLLAVWTGLGRQPRYREMNLSPSIIGSKAYTKRWGTWRKALHTFAERVRLDRPTAEGGTQPDSSARTVQKIRRPDRRADRRDIPLGLRYRVLVRDNFRCVLCGRSPASTLGLELHVDHWHAFSRGGKTVIENLRALCKECNLGKGAKHEAT